MTAKHLSRLACAVILLPALGSPVLANNLAAISRPADRTGIAAGRAQGGNRSSAPPLFNVTHAGSNMVRLGGTPTVPHGTVALSGSRVRPTSRINGQEFSRAVGSR